MMRKNLSQKLANKYYQQAIELIPEDNDTLANLTLNYKDEGRLQESISLILKNDKSFSTKI